MTVSVELFSIDQVDSDKKIFKVIPIFTYEKKLVTSPGGHVFHHIKTIRTFLAEPHTITIMPNLFQILLVVLLTMPQVCLQFVTVVFPYVLTYYF